MTTKLYCARWVLPVTRPVVEDGAVAIEEERLVRVGPRAELAGAFPAAEVQDFGEAAILPGLVNCHSHLELTAMRGFLEREEIDFFAWLRKLTAARAERMTADDIYTSAAWGAVEAARAGVTCLGDASDAGSASLRALRDVGLRGVVYQEAFGPDARTAAEQFDKLREKVAALRPRETALVRLGVSPHAPYTVSEPLLRLVSDFAAGEDLPLMMHAAESRAETLFMRDGAGPFAENLRRRGIEWHAPGVSTVRHLEKVGVLRARPLLAHCVTIDEADARTLRDAGASVAHCPKSNAKFGHGRAPLAALLREGMAVGLGTDSVASNNACDMLEEARFAALWSRAAGEGARENDEAREGDGARGAGMMSAADALALATIGGARALGLGGRVGSLDEGKDADFIVVSLSGTHQVPVHDAEAAIIFSSSGRDVLLTVVGGREVYKEGRVLTVDEAELRSRVEDVARRVSAVSS